MNFSLLRPQAHPSPRRDLEVLFQRFGLIDKFHSDVILSIIFKIVAVFFILQAKRFSRDGQIQRGPGPGY